MSSDTTATDDTSCACCGKTRSGDIKLKKCACTLVRYCSIKCQKEHRSQHKGACKKKIAELFDEKLFAPSPPKEDCPICFLPMPLGAENTQYKACCGKVICNGCLVAAAYAETNAHQPKCPFCRNLALNEDNAIVKQYRKRMKENNDPIATYGLAGMYLFGNMVAQDKSKAIELLTLASDQGSTEASVNLALMYKDGNGVARDIKKYLHYTQMAAMKGNERARFNLGVYEAQEGNNVRATKHFTIGARAGDDEALKMCTEAYKASFLTKDEFEQILRSHKEEKDSMKSEQRDVAMMELAPHQHMRIEPSGFVLF